MRALRFHGYQDIRIDDIVEPAIKPGHVKIKNAWCGICGSGHEFAGTIAELAPDVSDLAIGNKVAVFPIITDGTCHWCEQESYGLCPNWGFLGYSGLGGGMAEYIVVERKAVHKVPDHVPLDAAALVEPLAVGWHAVRMAKPVPEDCCLVLGAGPIGLAVIHALVAHDIKNIIVSEPSALRASQARQAGATHVLSPRDIDIATFVRENSPHNAGAHSVYECAGIPAAFQAALGSVRGRGMVINVAIYENAILEIPNPNALNRHQITIIGSNTYTRVEFQEVIDAIADGRIKNPETMITGRLPLEKAIDDGFGKLLAGVEGHVKILVTPASSPGEA
ncbi:hypothetical protein OHC33_000559 [Knufia fluminis]|uniref:Uncharacterized protein n=1 Tax=Knufia fluminis TaxID=191047 RepID=A0AAN8ICP0_9EURO|nr:hypothetical protein OHC33_000559 [Knufia fluminis]